MTVTVHPTVTMSPERHLAVRMAPGTCAGNIVLHNGHTYAVQTVKPARSGRDVMAVLVLVEGA